MPLFSILLITGKLARILYENMRREAAAIKIQKNLHRHIAKMSYKTLRQSAVVLQTGFRAMNARNEFRFRKQTKAATAIQVGFFYEYLEQEKTTIQDSI